MTVIAFDIIFVLVGAWAALRLVKTARSGSATYQRAQFARTESPAAFWSVTALNVALIAGAIYGVAVGAGL